MLWQQAIRSLSHGTGFPCHPSTSRSSHAFTTRSMPAPSPSPLQGPCAGLCQLGRSVVMDCQILPLNLLLDYVGFSCQSFSLTKKSNLSTEPSGFVKYVLNHISQKPL
ncbi:unnamed protein product [Coccothraustes coccothraustes]